MRALLRAQCSAVQCFCQRWAPIKSSPSPAPFVAAYHIPSSIDARKGGTNVYANCWAIGGTSLIRSLPMTLFSQSNNSGYRIAVGWLVPRSQPLESNTLEVPAEMRGTREPTRISRSGSFTSSGIYRTQFSRRSLLALAPPLLSMKIPTNDDEFERLPPAIRRKVREPLLSIAIRRFPPQSFYLPFLNPAPFLLLHSIRTGRRFVDVDDILLAAIGEITGD